MESVDNPKKRRRVLNLNSKVISAPMAGITDYVLRSLIRSFSKDVLLVSEMLSSEALVNNPTADINYSDNQEHPIAFQLSGHKPELMAKAAKIIESKADIIDINMGCPVNKVVKGNDGSALMKTPELACAIVQAVRASVQLPVTAKIRLGWTQETKNFIEFSQKLQMAGISAITLHARTRSQMYSGKADWEAIKLLKKEIDIPVFANGDIASLDDVIQCLEISCADGIAIGRGGLGNPFLFHQTDYFLKTGQRLPNPTFKEKILTLKKHLDKEIEFRGELVGIKFFRKFYSYYIKGIKNSAGYRSKLVLETDYSEILKILDELLKNG